jgi:galacturonokinase
MDIEPLLVKLRREMVLRYVARPETVRVIRSPYRICPLGAHIDHQLGPVTAMAIDRGILFAYTPATDREVRLCSLDFAEQTQFQLAAIPSRRDGDWGNYPRGAAQALGRKYPLSAGLRGIIAGRLGEGGLSSSAAVGVAYLLALEDVNGLHVSAEENIHFHQAIENDYLGLQSGLLDQAAILLSRRDHLTWIDCATLEHRLLPRSASMPPFTILIVFSGLQQSLVGTQYNCRVAQCTEAARILLAAAGQGQVARPVLGQLSLEQYAEYQGQLDGEMARRAAHFFSERQRVAEGVTAWSDGDLSRFGQLMTASGESSITNYECGCPPLIDLYQILSATPGVYGARFSGAGFRGCCVALVDPAAAADTVERVTTDYSRRHPDLAAAAPALLCQSDDGPRRCG